MTVLGSMRSQMALIRSFQHVQSFSSRGPPPAAKKAGYSIPAQGFLFTALLIPVFAYTMYAGRYGPSDEELEQEVRQRYSVKIAQNREKNEAMADFFQRAIHNPDGKVDETLKEVLYAGKGEKKRFHAVDAKLYGTEEGIAEKKRQEEERKKREEYNRKKKAGEIVEEKAKPNALTEKTPAKNEISAPEKSAQRGIVLDAQSAAALGAVAVVAAGVGFLAGGSRRS